jgi:RNA recognition motif-containing protein
MNIFVGCLPAQTPAEQLMAYFSQFKVRIISLKRKKNKGKKSPGYAILEVSSLQEFEVLLAKEHFLKGKKLLLKPYLSPEERLKKEEFFQQRRVYLKNLPENVTTEQIKEEFGKFGEIESIMTKKKGGTGRLYGFVTFEHEESAARCINQKRFLLLGNPVEAKAYKIKQSKYKGKESDANQRAGAENSKRKNTRTKDKRGEAINFTNPNNRFKEQRNMIKKNYKGIFDDREKESLRKSKLRRGKSKILGSNAELRLGSQKRHYPTRVGERIKANETLIGSYERPSFAIVRLSNGQYKEKLRLGGLGLKNSFLSRVRDSFNLRFNYWT